MSRVWFVALAFGTFILGAGFWWMSQSPGPTDGRRLPVEVRVPDLSKEAQLGERVFEARCADCHGANAAGSQKGPPLVHKIYEPGHHADFAFIRAIRQGVRSHHWPYDDMMPVEGVSDQDIQRLIAYVRELQRANGID